MGFVDELAKRARQAKNARLTEADRNRGWCVFGNTLSCVRCDSRIRKDPDQIQDGDACGFCKHLLKADPNFVLPEGVKLLAHDQPHNPF